MTISNAAFLKNKGRRFPLNIKNYYIYFSKIRKDVANMSSAAVVIGALMVNNVTYILHKVLSTMMSVCFQYPTARQRVELGISCLV